jgi:hypothetical protein
MGYILNYDYTGAPGGFSWALAKADVLRVLDGSYSFVPDDGGTQVGYVLAVDITIPLPGFMKKAAAGMIVQNAMKQLKEYIEAGGGAM